MIDSPEVPGNAGDPPAIAEVRSTGRRRLLQAGISAAPVVMTIVSRPVLADGQPGACTAPSGFVSINQSNPRGGGLCAGRTPGYWKNHTSAWPAGYDPNTKLFCDVFLCSAQVSGKTLLCVLEPQCAGAGPPFDVGRHIVAALLNTLTGLVPTTILSVPAIKSIWSQYITTGSYSPSAGVFWDHEQIVDYLLTTMPV